MPLDFSQGTIKKVKILRTGKKYKIGKIFYELFLPKDTVTPCFSPFQVDSSDRNLASPPLKYTTSKNSIALLAQRIL